MMRERIKQLIRRAGQQVVYKEMTSVARDENTGQKTNTFTSHTIYAHLQNFFANEIGGLIQEGDRACRIAAAEITFTPKQNDRLVVGEKEFGVSSVDIRESAEGVLEYILRIRGRNSA